MPDAGRVAVVIGGGNGIGEATCRLMHERGWRIVVADKDGRAAERVASATGGHAVALDIAVAAGSAAVLLVLLEGSKLLELRSIGLRAARPSS